MTVLEADCRHIRHGIRGGTQAEATESADQDGRIVILAKGAEAERWQYA